MATKNTILGTVPKSRGRYTEGDTTTKWYYDNILEYKGSSFRCISKASTGITGAPATYDANAHTLVPKSGWEFFVDTTGALDVEERLTENEEKLSELEIYKSYSRVDFDGEATCNSRNGKTGYIASSHSSYIHVKKGLHYRFGGNVSTLSGYDFAWFCKQIPTGDNPNVDTIVIVSFPIDQGATINEEYVPEEDGFLCLTTMWTSTVVASDIFIEVKTEYIDFQNTKVEKEEGKGLTSNDYTDEDKEKVSKIGIERVNYVNAYHYIFGVTSQDDITITDFSSWEAITADAKIMHDKWFKCDTRKVEWRVELHSDSVVIFGTDNGNADRNSQIRVDVVNRKLNVLTGEGGATQYNADFTKSISSGRVYIVRMEQHRYIQHFSIVDEKTLDVVAYVKTTATSQTTETGKMNGRPYAKLVSGYVKAVGYDVYLMYKPAIVFVGDGITECGYRQNSYSARVIDNVFNGNGCIVAQGGATIALMDYSLVSELPFMKPKYLSLLAGTNPAGSENTISLDDINRWKTFCNNNDIVFILNRVPVSMTPQTVPWDLKNSVIRSAGIIGANFDYATSVNNNPSEGADSSLFGDAVHPNSDGHQKMYERFVKDVQIIE